jgi:hypothetical protein
MTATIGVTGHRVLTEMEKVTAGIDEALAAFERRFLGGPLIVLSALAEGADRLVAERVLARPGSRLHAVLPLPRADYLTDFASAGSRQQFHGLLARAERVVELPPRASREDAYEAAGLHLLDPCDVLLAVWDGQGAQGQGGTGAIVGRARARGLPLAWVHAGNRRPGSLEPTTLGEAQGLVTLENF